MTDALRNPEGDPERFIFTNDSRAFLVGAHGGLLRAVEDGRELAKYGE